MRYEFISIDHCNMCGAPSNKSSVLGKRLNKSQGLRPTRKVGITTTIMKCGVCALVYSNPLPVPASMSQHYDVPAESYWSSSYFVLEEDYFRAQIDTFFRLWGRAGATLQALDIGAGVGKCMSALTKRGFEAYGLEPSEPFYRHAVETMEIPKDRISHMSLEEASYPDNMFDFVTFGAVLEHLYDPSAAILKALQWTRPGGLVHIEVPSSAWLTNRIANLVYSLQGLDYVSNISPMHTPFHLYEFGANSFEIHSKLNNYSVARVSHMVCSSYLPGFLDPLVKPFMRATKTGMQLEVWLRK